MLIPNLTYGEILLSILFFIFPWSLSLPSMLTHTECFFVIFGEPSRSFEVFHNTETMGVVRHGLQYSTAAARSGPGAPFGAMRLFTTPWATPSSSVCYNSSWGGGELPKYIPDISLPLPTPENPLTSTLDTLARHGLVEGDSNTCPKFIWTRHSFLGKRMVSHGEMRK